MAVSAKRTNEIRTLLRLTHKLNSISVHLRDLKDVLTGLPVVFTDTKTIRDELSNFQDEVRVVQITYIERYASETASSQVDAKIASAYLEEGIEAADALMRRINELYEC